MYILYVYSSGEVIHAFMPGNRVAIGRAVVYNARAFST